MKKALFLALLTLCIGISLTVVGTTQASLYADLVVYYEQGIQTHGGTWADPNNALYEETGMAMGVSLGQWSDNTSQGTNDRPVGLVLGFSTSIANGDGDDLNIVGNPFGG